MPEGMYDDLMKSEEPESFEKILVSLNDKEKVETQTEIQNPLNITRLQIFGVALKSSNKPLCAELIESFCLMYKINMLSHNRKSREEIIAALTVGLKENRNMMDKLSNPQDNQNRI
jgi:hypothetical protein